MCVAQPSLLLYHFLTLGMLGEIFFVLQQLGNELQRNFKKSLNLMFNEKIISKLKLIKKEY